MLIVVGGYTAFAYSSETGPFAKGPSSAVEDTNKGTMKNHDDATEKTDATQEKVVAPTDKTPKQNTVPANDSPSPSSLTGTVNYAAVVDGTLSIRTTFTQAVDSGSCHLVLKHRASGTTVTRMSDIVANPSSSTCNGFDIPASSLKSGMWDITVHISSGDMNGKLTHEVRV